MENKKINEIIKIYRAGYSTHCGFTLEEWLFCRKYCQENRSVVSAITEKIAGPVVLVRIK